MNPCKVHWQLSFYVFETPVGKDVESGGYYAYVFLLAFKKKNIVQKNLSMLFARFYKKIGVGCHSIFFFLNRPVCAEMIFYFLHGCQETLQRDGLEQIVDRMIRITFGG